MAVRRTRDADEDFARIYAYGLEDYGETQAEAYAQRLLQVFELLAERPYLGLEKRTKSRLVRIYPSKAHHILYIAEDEDVLILRVLHRSADWIDQL